MQCISVRINTLSQNRDNRHLKNKSVPEKLSIIWVTKKKVQESLHHPGCIGFSWVHPGCHHHSLLGLVVHSVRVLGCYCYHIHSVSSKTLAQDPYFAVWPNCRVGSNTAKVALQAWICVGVAVGQVAGVWIIRELECPGEWVKGDAITVVVLCILSDAEKIYF